MIKQFLRWFAFKVYSMGKEYEKAQKLQNYRIKATLAQGAIIDPPGSIINHQKQSAIKVGDRTIVRGNLMTFAHGGAISVGDCSFIGPGTRIWSAKKITIGNRVLIAHDVNIHDNNSHPLDSLARHKDQMHIMDKGFQPINDLNEKEIIIQDDAWIGFNATILKGVTIGKGAIIGASCVITKDVPNFAIVVGNPPQIIRYST